MDLATRVLVLLNDPAGSHRAVTVKRRFVKWRGDVNLAFRCVIRREDRVLSSLSWLRGGRRRWLRRCLRRTLCYLLPGCISIWLRWLNRRVEIIPDNQYRRGYDECQK